MAKGGKRKGTHHHRTPTRAASGAAPDRTPRRNDPPEVVALRALGPDAGRFAYARTGPTPRPVPPSLVPRAGVAFLAAHGATEIADLGESLAELVAAATGDERLLARVADVLRHLGDDRAVAYLRGVVAALAGESIKLQHDDALAGAVMVLLERVDHESVEQVVATRTEECIALARSEYGTLLAGPFLEAARGPQIDALARVVLDESATPVLGADDAVFHLAERVLGDDHAAGDALRAREVRALMRWSEWCDAISRSPLLPQSFHPERWHGAELRKLAVTLVEVTVSDALRDERWDDALALLDDPPAPVDPRHDQLARICVAVGAPTAVPLTRLDPSLRAQRAAAITARLDDIEALHEPECKRLDRPGAPYDEWVFEETALLMAIEAAGHGDWARAYDHADEFAYARHDRDVPIGVMYLLGLAAANEPGDLVLPEADQCTHDVSETPAARAFSAASDLLSALDHDYDADLAELTEVLGRFGIGEAADATALATELPDDPVWSEIAARLAAHLRARRDAYEADLALAAEQAAEQAVPASAEAEGDVEEAPWTDERAAAVLGELAAGVLPSSAVLEALGDHLVTATRRDLDQEWLARLDTDGAARSVLGDDAADIERVRVLDRLDRRSHARAIATGLFWRAVNGTTGPAYDAADLLELVTELGAPDEELAPLRRALEHDDAATTSDAASGAPVHVVFVGGNEIQIRYHAEIERSLPERVSVEWFTTGWSAQWGPEADRIEAAYENADAVVLMQFTRTQLGRRLRRTSGESGLPWIPCTGHGRESLRRAILRAVAVVDERRRGVVQQTAPS